MGCGSSTPRYTPIATEQPRKTLCGDLILAKDQRNKTVLMKRFTSLSMVSYESPTDELETLNLLREIPHPNLVGMEPMPVNMKLGTYHAIAVLQYSKMGDLHCIIQQQQMGYPIKIAIRLAKQLMSGINHLHTKLNRVHGDISCENILMFKNKTGLICKLVDYGFSRAVNGPMNPRSKTVVIGKPAYLAPELRTYQAYDGYAADIFAAGVCIYAMLYGHFPFESTASGDKHWSEYRSMGLTELTKRYGHHAIHYGLLHIISQMLKVNPAQRPNARQILSLLNNV